MGDSQRLRAPAQLPESRPDRCCNRPADTGIHLIKNQRFGRGAGSQHHFQGQQETGQLAARGNPVNRAWWQAGVGAGNKAHLLLAAGRPALCCQLAYIGCKASCLQLQRGQFPKHRLIQRGGSFYPAD